MAAVLPLALGFLPGDNREAGLVPGIHSTFQTINGLKARTSERGDSSRRHRSRFANCDEGLGFESIDPALVRIEFIERNALRVDDMAARKRFGTAQVQNDAVIINQSHSINLITSYQSAGFTAQFAEDQHEKADHQHEHQNRIITGEF